MNIIQLGSNNGDDHVLSLVKEKEGEIQELILVDALPECVELTRRQYSFFKGNLSVINVAIGTKNGLIDIFHPKGQSQSIHASSSPDHLLAHGHKEIEKIKVPCLNINSFLSSLSLDKIDYLFVDMEGMDIPTLLEMDFDKYTPTNLRFEYYHSDGIFSSGGVNLSNLLDKLKRLYHYSVSIENEYDMVARREGSYTTDF